MSLLQKASIITTPTAYAEDYLYSIKPAEYLGAELVTNGSFDTDSNWTKGTGWTISGGKANVNHTTFADLYQVIGSSVGKRYKIEFKVSNYVQGNVKVLVGYGGSDNGQLASANGVYNFETIGNPNGSDRIFLSTRSANTNLSVDYITVKEIIQADFDFDRNSTGTRVNEDYLIENVPYNLLAQSESFNTTWTAVRVSLTSEVTDPFGGLNAWSFLTDTTADNQHYITQAITESGVGTLSVYAKANGYNWLRMRIPSEEAYFDLANGVVGTSTASSASITNVGNGWHRCKVVISNLSSNPNVFIHIAEADGDIIINGTPSGNDGIYIYGAQLVKGDQPKDYLKTTDRLDIPRIDYTNGEPSILLEPQRVNLQTFSTDLNNALTAGSPVTITSNVTTSPENLQNADKITQTLDTRYQSRFSIITITAGSTWTRSIFAKKDTGNWMYLQQYDGVTNNGAYFDLENGIIGSNDIGITARMESYPNGWYRCSVTHTPNASATTERIQVALVDADNTSANKTGNGTGIFIYGAQLEEGSYATSLIHTSGSAVTRSADAANNAGNSDLINSTEGVLYAELKTSFEGTSGVQAISLQDSSNNYISIYFRDSNNFSARISASGGATQIDSKYVTEQFYKVALSYNSSNTKLFIDGRQIGNTTTTALVSGLNELAFDRGSGFGTEYEGNAKMIAVFKEALTDLELEKLTGYNNHELYMNYYNRLSYLGLAEEYNVESDINNYIL